MLQALKENLRQDGREFDQYRPVDLSFGDDYGHADVRLGKTRYVILRVSSGGIWTNIFSQSHRQGLG